MSEKQIVEKLAPRLKAWFERGEHHGMSTQQQIDFWQHKVDELVWPMRGAPN